MAVGHPASPLAIVALRGQINRFWLPPPGITSVRDGFLWGKKALRLFLKYFSGVKVRPTSCGCQEANTTYCYFTIQNRNQTSNGRLRASLSCPPNILIPQGHFRTLAPRARPFNAY
jgi:hypothetical protein